MKKTEVSIKSENKNTNIEATVGDYFEVEEEGDLYLLSRTTSNKVVLIGLEGGNRWAEPVTSSNNIILTQEEWTAVTDGAKFTKVSKINISFER